jgi:hypothetical protein
MSYGGLPLCDLTNGTFNSTWARMGDVLDFSIIRNEGETCFAISNKYGSDILLPPLSGTNDDDDDDTNNAQKQTKNQTNTNTSTFPSSPLKASL